MEELKAATEELIRLKTVFNVCKEVTENLLEDLSKLRDELRQKLEDYRQATKSHLEELEMLRETYRDELSRELEHSKQAARLQFEELKELRVSAEKYQDELSGELEHSKQATRLHLEELKKLGALLEKDKDELSRKLENSKQAIETREGLQEVRASSTKGHSEQEENIDPSVKPLVKKLRGFFGHRAKSKKKKIKTLYSSVSESVVSERMPTESIAGNKASVDTDKELEHLEELTKFRASAERKHSEDEKQQDILTIPMRPPTPPPLFTNADIGHFLECEDYMPISRRNYGSRISQSSFGCSRSP